MAASFYATPRGVVAGGLVRERLRALWPSLDGMSVLGVGYASPYVRVWTGSARRCVVAVPTQIAPTDVGTVRWPTISGNLTCTAEEDALPFADLSFDRVLLVHGIEAADNARAMLREVWRVLKDDGRLMVVAPNAALFMPPVKLRMMLRSAQAWETGGRYLAPHLAGVTITEAVKDVYAAIPVKRTLRRMVLSQAA
jgi:SAM-dependent methyltransferase